MKAKSYNKISTPVFAILALILFAAMTTKAAPGDLDPTFGIGGKLTDWTGGAHAVVIQADGKIVAVGRIYFNSYVFAVARYNEDGSPDATFGNAGRVSFPVGDFGHAFGIDAAIQSDGKIIVTCYDDDQGYGAIVRLNVNGSLDTSFGSNGMVNTGGGHYSVAIQLDGKIITSAGVPYNNPGSFGIRRYNANGSVDTTFGNGGVTDLPIYATAVVLQSDGKIVAAGQAFNADAFAVARLNPDGTADQSFGNGGLATAPIGSGAYAVSVSVQSDGKIVAVGNRWTGSGYADYSLVRFNTNGSLDTTFDNDGIVRLTVCCWSYFTYRHVVALNDGKILVSGSALNGSNYDFAIGRYNSNGSLDTTFGGGDGIATVDFNNSNDYADSMALDAQGRAVVVGGSNQGFALARFLLRANPTFDFDGDGRADVSVFRPSDRTWYLNQSTNGFSAMQFGLSTDTPVPADYDGDGKTDLAVYRDGTWYWLNSSSNTIGTRQFGIASDIPVPANYSFGGPGLAELAVYRAGTWWIRNRVTNQETTIQFGLASDKPVPADYDGDGRTDLAVYRNGEWHLNRSSLGYTVVQFGLPTDKPVVGDYDGDGKADQAVFREGTWYINRSQAGVTAFQWGLATDIPTPADYDGDGKTDAAAYRNGTWYLLQSTSGPAATQFGLANDKPIPAAYLP